MVHSARVLASINLQNLQHNYQTLLQKILPCQLIPVLKANAYGLGFENIAPAFSDLKVNSVGVATIEEAMEAKKYFKEIHILGDICEHEMEEAIQNDFICPLSKLEHLALLQQLALRYGKEVRVQIYLDTGMSQLGMTVNDALELANNWRFSNVKLVGLYTHFYDANDKTDKSVEIQLSIYRKVLDSFLAKGHQLDYRHVANSNGVLNFPQYCQDLTHARVGIALYGVYPKKMNEQYSLKPVLELKSQITLIKKIKKGDIVGYNGTFQAKENMVIASVPMGYADGLMISASNKGFALINGVLCPMVGRVSMDYVSFDITKLSMVELGEEVIFCGESQGLSLTVSDMAAYCGTIPYEILCSLGLRLKKVYIDN